MYKVYENDKECGSKHFDVSDQWDQEPQTLKKAQNYAKRWMGLYGHKHLQPNEEYDMSGYGDTIVIKEV